MPDYRQVSGGAGALGVAQACATCYLAVQLYYSAISATDVCCNVVATTTYYILQSEGTFANATTLYADTLGNTAANGYYRQ